MYTGDPCFWRTAQWLCGSSTKAQSGAWGAVAKSKDVGAVNPGKTVTGIPTRFFLIRYIPEGPYNPIVVLSMFFSIIPI